MKILKCTLLFLVFSLNVFGDVKTGCLVQGDTQLYTHYIGLRDPYWANPNPTTPAYNGTPTAVDNRQDVDILCGTYYITSRTTNPCFQYSNGSPPAFVSSGGNGVIATITEKCVPVPFDDHLPVMFLAVAVASVYSIHRKFNAKIS